MEEQRVVGCFLNNSYGRFFGPSLSVLILVLCLSGAGVSQARQPCSILDRISSKDALVVADPDGRILYSKNEDKLCTPASTLKILTGLAAIHYLGAAYRFETEFYVDDEQNLKVKGYGDPLLVSEVWREIAGALAPIIRGCKGVVVDDAYFSQDIDIPGVGSSTNPYDAPNGALCANFNTVSFEHNASGKIVSAESQTPITPLAREKIRSLGLRKGRHTFSHKGHEASRYAGELLFDFLTETGRVCAGGVRADTVHSGDRLIYTYRSIFTVEEAVGKMLEFSNNFIANQLLLTLGAHVHGPPGTVAKGVAVLSDFVRHELQLEDVEIAEGSGISRQNRLSALDMLAVLRRFAPYRALLVRKGPVLCKTGTLNGVRTRAGYIEGKPGRLYAFVIFLNSSRRDIDSILDCVKKGIDHGDDS